MRLPVVGPTWSDVHGIAARVVIYSRTNCNCPPVLEVRARNSQYADSLTPEMARHILPQFEDLVQVLEEVAAS